MKTVLADGTSREIYVRTSSRVHVRGSTTMSSKLTVAVTACVLPVSTRATCPSPRPDRAAQVDVVHPVLDQVT